MCGCYRGRNYAFCAYELPLKLDIALYALPIFCLGILLQSFCKKIGDISLIKQLFAFFVGLALSIAICILYYMSAPDITLRIEYVIFPWYWISIAFGTVWVIALALLVVKVFREKRIVIYLGRNSIVFYCFNDILFKVSKAFFFVALKMDIKSLGLAGQLGMGVLIVILTISVTIPINKLICKDYLF